MAANFGGVQIYHITEVANLANILATKGLLSDALVSAVPHQVIGHGNIKQRRLTELTVPCCGNRFVGQFVPFYFCPRSPMLYSINRGNTGKPVGHQREILHLVSTVGDATALGRDWAISDGNAGAYGVSFFANLAALRQLDWDAIRSNQWSGITRQKQAEFLVADFFPWSSIREVACMDATVAKKVGKLLQGQAASPNVVVQPTWYY